MESAVLLRDAISLAVAASVAVVFAVPEAVVTIGPQRTPQAMRPTKWRLR